MRNLQKGFIIPFVAVLVSLFLIGSGVYVFINKKPTSSSSGSSIATSSGSLKIVPPPNGGIYIGAYNWGGDGIKAFEDALGKKVAISGGGSGSCRTPEGVVEDYGNISCAQEVYTKGYIGGFEFRCGNMNNYQQEIIDGKFDTCLTNVAQNIKLLNQPMFWIYPREPSFQIKGGYGPNGDQNRTEGGDNYGQFGCTDKKNELCLDGPERYRVAQQHVHDLVEGICKDCVTWVAPAPIYTDGPSIIGQYTWYYPGDSYVDWHAIDYYPITSTNASNAENLKAPVDLISNSLSPFNIWYDYIVKKNPTKPILLLEFGPIGVNEADSYLWFKDFFKTVKEPKYKNINAFLYWQASSSMDSIYTSSRIDPGTTIGNLWRAEIAANPNFWVSDVVTAGGNKVIGNGGGIVQTKNTETNSKVLINEEKRESGSSNLKEPVGNCFDACRANGQTIDYCNSHC